MSPVGRLPRFSDGRWLPVGEPLPPFEHAPPNPSLYLAPWVLPKEPSPQAGDVLAIGELAHVLMVHCERDDPLYLELAEQTLLFRGHEETMAWLEQIEVWVGRRLEPGETWPEPRLGRS